ncbi:hypothetical protein ACFQ8W_01730 [Streptomyces sp. NPDC056508]|uniref:hypothetical protein n=1 Tax=Streptomyces sp. NPDC056508 TaxID=3345845 RepID=UPI00368798D9
MSERKLTPEEMRVAELLYQLQALSPDDATTAARITVRMPDGTYMGDALLSADAVVRLNDATFTMATPWPDGHDEDDDTIGGVDRLLVADLEDMYADINPMSLLNLASDAPNPEASEKALREMFGEVDWPGRDGGQP